MRRSSPEYRGIAGPFARTGVNGAGPYTALLRMTRERKCLDIEVFPLSRRHSRVQLRGVRQLQVSTGHHPGVDNLPIARSSTPNTNQDAHQHHPSRGPSRQDHGDPDHCRDRPSGLVGPHQPLSPAGLAAAGNRDGNAASAIGHFSPACVLRGAESAPSARGCDPCSLGSVGSNRRPAHPARPAVRNPSGACAALHGGRRGP